jgi:hypothetical protein
VGLLATTGDSRADAVLSDVVASIREAVGSSLRSVYIAGSYADGTAVPLSDVDVIAVLRQGSDEQLTRHVASECAQRSPIRLDLAALTTTAIAEGSVALVPAFRLGTVLVYGVDVRDEVVMPDLDEYAAAWADRARSFMSRIRHVQDVERPLSYPDATGEFLGYDRATISEWYPPETLRSTKELVAIVGSAATALVAQVGGAYVPTKAACVQAYVDQVGDEWTDLIRDVHDLCRTRLKYGVPVGGVARSELRELCERVLAFENHALAQFPVRP